MLFLSMQNLYSHFVKRGNILDAYISVQEIVTKFKIRKSSLYKMGIKIGIEKTFDNINWRPLNFFAHNMWFLLRLISLVKELLLMVIIANVCQLLWPSSGCPHLPFLFVICLKLLAKFIEKLCALKFVNPVPLENSKIPNIKYPLCQRCFPFLSSRPAKLSLYSS